MEVQALLYSYKCNTHCLSACLIYGLTYLIHVSTLKHLQTTTNHNVPE